MSTWSDDTFLDGLRQSGDPLADAAVARLRDEHGGAVIGRIFAKLRANDSPDVDMPLSINPYRGCAHACLFCEARQLELAIAIAQQPRLLLLDEPMAGMGRKDGVVMTQLLARLKKDYSIILIEHDMQAVFSLADRISVLVAGHIIKTGAPEAIRSDPDVRAAYLGH